jgi:peptidoglycan/LPS O-acetylase OafA/YrhL
MGGRRIAAQNGSLYTIQYLRAAAALLIVFHHSLDQYPRLSKAFPITTGAAGVDIFFVISGFIMTVVTARAHCTGTDFLVRRVTRIVPLYWLFTVLTAALCIGIPSAFKNTTLTWSHFVLSLLFIPHASPGTFDISPLLKLGWTLNFEILFYVLFALLMRMQPRMRLIAFTLVFTSLTIAHRAAVSRSPLLVFWGNPILFEFLFGCVVGRLYIARRLSNIPTLIAGGGLIAAIAVLLACGVYNWAVDRTLISGVPAAALVAMAVALEEKGVAPWVALWARLGDASYSLYLSHLFCVIAFRKIWSSLGMEAERLALCSAFMAFGIVVSAVVAIGVHTSVELPMLAWARHFSGGRRQIAAGHGASQSS